MVMGNQERILSILGELLGRNIDPFIEVETNGSIVPRDQLLPYINQWNVSMKLSNSGMDEDERINGDAITRFIAVHQTENGHEATFKFVVGHESDLEEVAVLQGEHDIPDSMITLMPAGQTREQLQDTYPKVAEWCKSTGWRFSPRLHVNVWDQATGV